MKCDHHSVVFIWTHSSPFASRSRRGSPLSIDRRLVRDAHLPFPAEVPPDSDHLFRSLPPHAISLHSRGAKTEGSLDWYVDSGASYHYCHHRDWFDTFEPLTGQNVSLGDGHRVPLAGKGTLRVSVSTSSSASANTIFHNVQYVPNPLFSSSSFLLGRSSSPPSSLSSSRPRQWSASEVGSRPVRRTAQATPYPSPIPACGESSPIGSSC